MPIVTVQVTRDGSAPGRKSVTPEEKAAIIKGVSEVLLNVLSKPLESTYVVIEEVDLDNGAGAASRRSRTAENVPRHNPEARSQRAKQHPLTGWTSSRR
ncbi:4-oxalocrotonate tautomerase family enzyme [Sinorhizobium fredii]|nr:4-oxalocrotonate tautomerase [Sinorhizobium fredii CCBAU 83666]GEC34590.1 hypothetical protein EFR01_47610 [Sinorhizobium fredii]GLS10249.1 hypothetical protein GCM10007864_38800 [Sinorhizobium fredii]